MPTSLAAALAAAFFAVSLTSVTPTPATAAEVLERAAAAEAAFDGWVTVELRGTSDSGWYVSERAQPAAGLRWRRDLTTITSPDDFDRDDFSWTWSDRSGGLIARYDAPTGEATLASSPPDAADAAPPSGVEALAAQLRGEYAVTVSATGDRVEATSRDGSRLRAHRLVFHLEAGTGLLHSVEAQADEAGPLRPIARVTYGAEPIADWRTLLPPGTAVRDLRLEADTEAVLAMLDDIEERGLGLPTAVVVTRTGDFHRGVPIDRGRVTLYASGAGETLKLGWTDGPAVPGWPEPSLEQVLAHAEEHPPQAGLVSGGRAVWFKEENAGTWDLDNLSAAASERLAEARIARLFWPTREQVVGESGFGVALSGQVLTGGFGNLADFALEARPIPGSDVVDLPGPTLFRLNRSAGIPATWIDQRPRQDWQTDRHFDMLGAVIAIRPPFHLPSAWRTQEHSPAWNFMNMPEFHRLLPFPDVTLDATWFTDPRERWPARE